MPRRRLDRDRVIAAAIALADDAGLEAVSMRRLGEALGVTPMALYKHVEGREELIDAMLDRMIERLGEPTPGPDWKSAVRSRIQSARDMIERHPWARTAIETRTLASPAVLAYMDSLMGAMFAGGLSADLVHHAMHALSTRMWGFTRDVLPTPRLPDEPAARAAEMGRFAAVYPSIVRMATTAAGAGAGCDERAEFDFALDILLDAFERLHATGWSSAPRER